MSSVREILTCLGHPEGGSVRWGLFGYPVVPKQLSVRTQVDLMKGKHYHVNVILVAPEDYPEGDFPAGSSSTHQICYSLQVTREIYANVGLGIGRVEWYFISREQAGGYVVIDSSSEASDLTEDWTVDNDALDLFVVRIINGADGWSEVDGDCDKDAKGMTGSVVELYPGNDDYAANGFAHEMGHYLGLDHISDSGNFIGGDGASDSWTGIYDWQGSIMRSYCFVHDGC